MTTLAGMGVFQTELAANQVPPKPGVPDVVGGGAETLTVADWLALPPGPLQVRVKAEVAFSAPVLAVPLVCLLPDQPPDAVQLLVFVDDQLSVAAEPLAMLPGLALSFTAG